MASILDMITKGILGMGLKMGSLLFLFFIILLLFGTRRLRTLGEDLAVAVKSFRKGLQEEEKRDPHDRD